MVTAIRIKIITEGIEPVPAQDKEGSSEQTERKMDGLSVYLGPPWTKDDLKSFYVAYRQNGKDWIKIARMLSNRTPDMVENLYKMNKDYLSLSREATSAKMLIKMVMDHYNLLEKLRGVKSDTTVFMQNGFNLDHAAPLQENQESQERKGEVQRKRRKGQENHWKASKPLTHETISFTYEGAHRYNEEEESMDMGAVEGMREKEVQEKRWLPSAPGNEKGNRQLFYGEGNNRFDILSDVASMICNGTLSLPELDSGY